MKNKCVLITGSSRGIGADIARAFAKEGYNVIINYNKNYEQALLIKNEISKYNVDSLIIKADISNENEVKTLIDKIVDKFGNLDVVVNNAAIARDNYLEYKSVDEFRDVINVNLVGTFIVSKYASKIMNNGSIINISSTNGIDTLNEYSMDYDASKSGVISLTKNLAKALPNIRINCVCPGWINTDDVLNMNPDIIEEEKKKIIMNRFGNPEEVANVVCFLASDKASYINGSIIRVDGGVK